MCTTVCRRNSIGFSCRVRIETFWSAIWSPLKFGHPSVGVYSIPTENEKKSYPIPHGVAHSRSSFDVSVGDGIALEKKTFLCDLKRPLFSERMDIFRNGFIQLYGFFFLSFKQIAQNMYAYFIPVRLLLHTRE